MYPIFIDLRGKTCLLVGGGPIAERKARGLVEAGAQVTIVAPTLVEPLAQMVAAGQCVWQARPYASPEAQSYFLVIAATSDTVVNRTVSGDAQAADRLVNVVDVPSLCTFVAPSVLRRGHLQVAVSTGGAFPALSKMIRTDLESRFPDRWADLVDELAALRITLRERIGDAALRQERMRQVLDSHCLESYLQGDPAPLRKKIAQCVLS